MNSKIHNPSKTANLPNLKLSDIYQLKSYFYRLPEELIAQHPCRRRDHARLLVIDRLKRTIRHDTFNHLKDYLPDSSLLAVNNSRVIPARLLGRRLTGGAVEIFLLNPQDDGYSFEVLLRPLKKIREGEKIDFNLGFSAIVTNKEKRIVRFNKKNIIRHLKEIGHIPLPPYIQRPDTPRDREDYQTVYAKIPGSVASPTAGLHFTHKLMDELESLGHQFLKLTLHINYGTFKPVECDDIRQHQMHKEFYSLGPAGYKTILQAKNKSRAVVAVGTTSARVLESVGTNGILQGQSDIFIFPGFKFKMVDALITNFHLPHSTLLMLVCAFGGYDLVMRAYHEAIKKRYRFYSYGDAMLIL